MCSYSLLTLAIEKMEWDWGKNLGPHRKSPNHSVLFQKFNQKGISRYYCELDDDNDTLLEDVVSGFSATIGSIKKRLDLLGYTLTSINKLFTESVSEWAMYGDTEIKLSYDTFYKVIFNLNISDINSAEKAIEFEANGFDDGEYVKNCVFYNNKIIEELLSDYEPFDDDFSRTRAEDEISAFLEGLCPYVALRIFAENPNNSCLELKWMPQDELGEFCDCEDINVGCPEDKKILIVTEGPTDTMVLSKAIAHIEPSLSDFFRFIDMKNKYPFGGTGLLENFCKGLISINVLNNILVILDNDTAGVKTYNVLYKLKKPNNLVITKLPDNPLFSNVQTVGPQGRSSEDINGKAVSIECFLDFSSVSASPLFRWTSYDNKVNKYQGVIENKSDYTDAFEQCNLKTAQYDITKLELLIKHIYDTWVNH
jgi:hypothetical protein